MGSKEFETTLDVLQLQRGKGLLTVEGITPITLSPGEEVSQVQLNNLGFPLVRGLDKIRSIGVYGVELESVINSSLYIHMLQPVEMLMWVKRCTIPFSHELHLLNDTGHLLHGLPVVRLIMKEK